MPFRDEDPANQQKLGVDTAADRRRAGRQDVRPELIPMLRGQIDRNAPADPDIPPPPRLRSIDRELVSGALFVSALMLAGVVLRFAV